MGNKLTKAADIRTAESPREIDKSNPWGEKPPPGQVINIGIVGLKFMVSRSNTADSQH